jgi:hypothetical protein
VLQFWNKIQRYARNGKIKGLRSGFRGLKMTKNEILREIVKHRISLIQKRNPSYSKRKFAADIDMSSGSLIDFLNGKREFSSKTINKIVSRLDLQSKEMHQIASAPAFIELLPGSAIQIKFSVKLDSVTKLDRIIRLFLNRLKKFEEESPGQHECSVEIRK